MISETAAGKAAGRLEIFKAYAWDLTSLLWRTPREFYRCMKNGDLGAPLSPRRAFITTAVLELAIVSGTAAAFPGNRLSFTCLAVSFACYTASNHFLGRAIFDDDKFMPSVEVLKKTRLLALQNG